jgi:hypothetical protein
MPTERFINWRRGNAAGQRGSEVITASELACFAYCPEQWRLQYGLELLPANGAAMDAGNRHHARKGLAERIAGAVIVLGRVLIVLAFLVLVAWVLLR